MRGAAPLDRNAAPRRPRRSSGDAGAPPIPPRYHTVRSDVLDYRAQREPYVNASQHHDHVDRSARAASPVHVRRDGDAHRHPRGLHDPRGCRPTSSRTSTSRSSPSSGTTRASRPRRWRSASSRNYERVLTTTVNDIEHIESQSLDGVAVIKIFFQPGAQIDAATAQVTAVSQTVAPADAAGHDAAAHHPLQRLERADPAVALESDTLSEQQLFDYGTNFVRADMATVPGAQIPWPYGGKQRQIMVDIDPQRLYALRALAARRHDRDHRAEPDPARPARRRSATNEYSGRAQQRAPRRRRRSTTSRSRPSTARRSTSATSPTCATALAADQHRPRRAASARVLMSILKNGNASTLDIVDAHQGDAARASRARLPEGAEGHAALRPVALRARGGRRASSRRRRSPPASPR